MKNFFTSIKYRFKLLPSKGKYMYLLMCFLVGSLNVSMGQLQVRTDHNQLQEPINLQVENQSLVYVLDKLEQQSGYVFIYSNEVVDAFQHISLKAKDCSLEKVLKEILVPQGINYQLFGKQIVLSLSKEKIRKIEKKSGEVESSIVSSHRNYDQVNNAGNVLLQINMQDKMISGQILSEEDNEPIPGVNVVLQGTSTGTVTDINGRYSINVPDNNAVLVFSSVGFKTQEVIVGARSVLDIMMEPDVQKLQELVVVGYGTTTRRALTGSVSKINAKDLQENVSTNIAAGLQGRASGVQVIQQGGQPGAGVSIRVRGVSSINSGSDPLIVVDGVPSGMDLNEINPNDIESVEVLKDASAGAIYGSRAANGVILITTKKGKVGKSQVSIDYQQGINNPTNKIDYLSGSEYLRVTDQAYWNDDPARQSSADPYAPVETYGWQGFDRSVAEGTNTDWEDLITQQAGFKQLSLSVGGGSEDTRIYLSGQFRDEDSYIKDGKYQRANLRLNLDHEVNKWLSVGTNLTGTFTFEDIAPTSWLNSARTDNLTIYPVYAPSDPTIYFNGRDRSGGDIGTNILFFNEETWQDKQNTRTFTSGYFDIHPLKGLSFRSTATLSYNSSRNRRFYSRDYQLAGEGIDPNAGGGAINYYRGQSYNWNIDNVLTYEWNLSDHNFSAMVGNNIQSYFSDGNGLTEEGFPSDYFTLTNANTEIVQTRVSTSIDEYRFASFFGRLKYSLQDKYFAEVNYRADASSRFGPENRWGYFPGAALAWAISGEDFMQSISAIEYLKLRVSYGSVGNAEMGNFPYLSTLVGWAPYGGPPGFLFNNIGNKGVKWEKQVQLNAGLDFTVLKGRVGGSIEYFKKDAKDLLVSYKIGNFHGYFSSSINQNLGTLTNQGFDLNINTQNLVGEFKWTTDFNISRARAKITQLSPSERNIDAGTNRVVEDEPLGVYFLPIWAGVDPTTGHELIYAVDQGDVEDRDPYMGDLTGDVIDANRLGNSEYNNHRVLLTDKTPYPEFYGGINNRFSYKNFDFNFLLSFQQGNYIYDKSELQQVYPTTNMNLRKSLLNGWTRENPTNVPLMWGSAMTGRNNTRFLHDGSYIRLRNVTLGYNLPSDITQRLGLANVRIYVMGQNLLTFTEYPGLDPELYTNSNNSRDNNLSPGIAELSYPQMKSFIGGINLSF